jgi:Gpi18-like mannosyltransferase
MHNVFLRNHRASERFTHRFGAVFEKDHTLFWILLVALILRIVLIACTPPKYLSWEGREVYLQRAQSVLEGKLPYRDYWESNPPLWTLTFALWGSIFGITVVSLKALICTAEIVFLVILYFFTKRVLKKPRYGHYAVLLYAFLPVIPFISAVEGKYESLTFCFIIGSLWLLINKRTTLAGIVLGVGMAYKYNAGLVLPAVILYLLQRRSHPVKEIAIYGFSSFMVLFFVFLPFIVIAPGPVFQDTIKAFVTGTAVHAYIEYKAISPWGALWKAFHIKVPTILPYLFQAGLVLLVFGYFFRKRRGASDFDLLAANYVFIGAFLLFIRAGNIQYHAWDLPFGVLLAGSLLPSWRTNPKAKRFIRLFILHNFLMVYTWKNWVAPIPGSILVVITLGIGAALLWMVVRDGPAILSQNDHV